MDYMRHIWRSPARKHVKKLHKVESHVSSHGYERTLDKLQSIFTGIKTLTEGSTESYLIRGTAGSTTSKGLCANQGMTEAPETLAESGNQQTSKGRL